MADENTGVVEQSHESTTESPQPFTSFLDQADEVDQSGTEQAESETEGQGAEAVEGAETEGDDANWLPSEQLKVFPQEVIARYAKRFGYTPEEIAADERLANALSKMINSDIHIQNISQAEEEAEEESGEEGVEQEQSLQTAPDAEALEKARSAFVDQITEPKTATKFYADLNAAIKNAAKDEGLGVTKVLTRGMVNIAPDIIQGILFTPGPDGKSVIQRYIESTYEGFGESHETSARQSAIERVRQSNPAFSKLPNYGSPELRTEMQKAAEILPGFENVVFRDKNGQPLSPIKNFEKKVAAAAHLLYGSQAAKQNVVKEANEAVETGKRIAQDSARKKNLANLGAGKSKGLTPAKLTGNDDLFGSPGEVNISQKLIGRLS